MKSLKSGRGAKIIVIHHIYPQLCVGNENVWVFVEQRFSHAAHHQRADCVLQIFVCGAAELLWNI